MLRLTALTIDGYRSFPSRSRMDLRPLTLLYGWNNAGKSALLRLLPILADSVAEAAVSPFELRRTYPDATFRDAQSLFQGSNRIHIELEWGSEGSAPLRDRIELMVLDEPPRPPRVIVSELTCWGPDGSVLIAAKVRLDKEDTPFDLEGLEEPRRIVFDGLVPREIPDLPALGEFRSRLIGLRNRVIWLSSVRAHPERLIQRSLGSRLPIEPDGQGATEAVATRENIWKEVANWFQGPKIRRTLWVEEVNHPYCRLLLSPVESVHRAIHLLDAGEGMIQVLPVLTALAMSHESDGPTLLAIEEPESHLHGNAQQALAEHLARAAAAPSAPTILLETHSRVLLLSVQLAVARGILPRERVGAYWVEQDPEGRSLLSEIRFSPEGRLSNWPRSAFEEDSQLARALLTQQQESET